jgi:hypothetical protein
MCVVGGCTTCSRNVYEPCPTVTPTYTQSSYYSQSSYYIQSAYEDTPDIGTEDPTAPRVNLYIKKQGTAGWSKNLQVSPEDEVSLRWVTINTNQCQSTDTTEFTVSDTSGTSGNTDTVNEQATGLRVYEIACQGTNGARVTSPASLTILATPLTFTATPRIVRTNETSKLIWNVYGRTGCTIAKKANNTDLSTVSISAGERDTQPLTGETTYLLSCPDGASAETTIRVLPIISET